MSVNREESQTVLALSSAAHPLSELLYLFSSSPKTPPTQQQLEVRVVGCVTGRLWQMLNGGEEPMQMVEVFWAADPLHCPAEPQVPHLLVFLICPGMGTPPLP